MMSVLQAIGMFLGQEPMSVTQSILLVMGVVGLLAVALSALKKGRKIWEPRTESQRNHGRASRHEAESLRDIESAMIQLDELAKQITGRIDAKLSQLDTAIREADSRIDALSRHSRSAQGLETVDITVDEESDAENPERNASLVSPEPHHSIYRLADSGLEPVEVAQEVGRPIGEVELILALRRTRGSADGSHELPRNLVQSPHAA